MAVKANQKKSTLRHTTEPGFGFTNIFPALVQLTKSYSRKSKLS
jgi:hypothetical protein